MQEFQTYLSLGFDHILDWNGYDHLLFVIALCAGYSVRDWKKIAVLITAFTLGHSLTLLLSALDFIRFPSEWVEILIPVTILLTGMINLWRRPDATGGMPSWLHYALATVFGLIHGMGFSGYFKALLGKMQHFIFPLFSFNLGIELGQLVIVAAFLCLSMLLIRFSTAFQREVQVFVSGIGAGAALLLIFERVQALG